MSAISGTVGNSWDVTYTAPKEATLITGREFRYKLDNPVVVSSASVNSIIGSDEEILTGQEASEILKAAPGAYGGVVSVTFDYYKSEYDDVINNAVAVADVATSDSEGDILMYHLGDDSNGYDVYVLSQGDIYANADCSLMFCECISLSNVIFNNFNTSRVTNMEGMFESTKLKILDLSGFDTSNVTNMSAMFGADIALTTIYVGNGWSTENLNSIQSMFYMCRNLVGGNGTKYNSSYTDSTYARVDTASTPGYLTLKS